MWFPIYSSYDESILYTIIIMQTTPLRSASSSRPSKQPSDPESCKRGEYHLYEKEGKTRLRYVPYLGNQIVDALIEQEEDQFFVDDDVFDGWEEVEEWLKTFEIPIYKPGCTPEDQWYVVLESLSLVLYVREKEEVLQFPFFLGSGTEILSGGDKFPTFDHFLAVCVAGENGSRFPALPEDTFIYAREKKEVEAGTFMLFLGRKSSLFVKGVSSTGSVITREVYAKQKLFVKEEECIVGPFASLDEILFYLGIQDVPPPFFPYTAPFVKGLPLDKQRCLQVLQEEADWQIIYRQNEFSLLLFVEGRKYTFKIDEEGYLAPSFADRKISFEEMIPGNAFEEKWKPFLPVGARIHPELFLFHSTTRVVGKYHFARTQEEVVVFYFPFGYTVCLEFSLVLEEEGFSYNGNHFSNWETFFEILQKTNLGRVRFFPKEKVPTHLEVGESYVTPGLSEAYQYVIRVDNQFIRRIEFSFLEGGQQVIDCRKQKYVSFDRFVSRQKKSTDFCEPFLSDRIVWSYGQARKMTNTSSDLIFSLTFDQRPGVVLWKKSLHDIWIRWRVDTSTKGVVKLFDGDVKKDVLHGEFSSFEDALTAIDAWERSLPLFSEITGNALFGTEEKAPPTALIDEGYRGRQGEIIYMLQVDGRRVARIFLMNTQFLVCSSGLLQGQMFTRFEDLVNQLRESPPLDDEISSGSGSSSDDEASSELHT